MGDPARRDGRILILGLGWFPDQAGGANRYVRELVEHSGPSTSAVVVGPAVDAPERVHAISNHDAPLLARLVAYSRAARALARDADVVDAHFALYAFVPVLLGIARRRRLIVHFHGPWAEEAARSGSRSRLVASARRFVERTVYRRASFVVTLSNAFADLVVSRYGVDRSRVRVTAPGVDTVRFAPGDQVTARKNLGLPVTGFLVVTARRLVPRAGVDVLVRAAAELARNRNRDSEGAPLTVVMAGTGPEATALRVLATELDAPVRFLDEISDAALVDLYRAADVAVVPSRALEGFGLVVLEALACGTPVIVSDVDGLTEAVAGLPADVIVPAGDVRALAARLRAASEGRAPLPNPAECRAYAEGFPWSYVAAAQRALTCAPLRVVFVDHTAARSGGEIAMVRLIEALQSVVVAHVLLLEDGPIAEDLRSVGAEVEVLVMPESTRGLSRGRVTPTALPIGAVVASAATTVVLARRLRALRPDLVHANSLKAGFLVGPAARAAGIPLVWSMRDRLADDYLPNSAAALTRGFVRVFPAAVIANSETTRNTVGAVAKVVTIPDPYDAPTPSPPRVPNDALRVVMIGRIAPWKGQDVVIDAFATAFPNGDALLTLVGTALFGEDDFERSLPERAAALGVADRVTFTGFVDDVAGVLAGADIAVHASVIPEPHGQVVVEAMAAGVPVIAAAAGGPTEIITDGVDGILVPPGDVGALVGALTRLANDAGLRTELSAAGRRRADAFRGVVIAPRVAAVYHSVLSGHR